jgi:hypothetical protein
MRLDRSFRRTLLAGLLLSAGPSTTAALLIAAPGCSDWLGRDDIRCFEWPDELGACLDREQAVEELNTIDRSCNDQVVSVESAKQRDGLCCYKVTARNYARGCPTTSAASAGGSGPVKGSVGHSGGGGGQSGGGGGQSGGGGGQSGGGGSQSGGGGGQSGGGGGQSGGGGGGRF